eukprot:RCo003015
MWRNRSQYHTPRSDFGALTDFYIAQHFGTGTDHHSFTDLRMTIAVFFTCTTQCHVLQNRNIIPNNGGFSNDNTRRMIEHNTETDLRCRMNIHTVNNRNLMLQE